MIPSSFISITIYLFFPLSILRWIEAYNAGKAPKIIAESTHEMALKYISKDILMKYNN